ncbi:MAG TPA: hemerythrin domain-containing protein [Candidatus Anammoximicrobium sp.]|nr:hemerythrin domain-containing protein [Candidatus Anammoximicrobium sp.]
MAKEQIFQEPMVLAEVRVDHSQDVLQDISDSFYESADALARMRDRIARLAEEMASRFAAEEQSGRYEDALCQAPWLTARAQELRQQHIQLIETLNGLRRRCESSDGPVAWWTRIQKDFTDFSELLREHEGAEKNLLEEMHPAPDWGRD